MEVLYWIILIGALILSLIAIRPYFKITKRNKRRWLIGSAIFLWCLLLIFLFVRSTGNILTWDINTSVWSNFGAFIGAFLFAGTLLFQIRAFRRQQVEAKFYEMVKYYRENISEMRFRNPFYYKDGDREVDEEFLIGRRVIKTIFEQYKVALKHVDEQLFSNSPILSKCKFKYTNENYTDINEITFNLTYDQDLIEEENWNKFHVHSNLAYLITFWGTPHDITIELDNRLTEVAKEWSEPTDSIVKNIIETARKLIAVYECKTDAANYSGSLKNKSKSITKCGKNNGKLKFFGGHQYHLAHYFRHFYRSVRYIDQQPSWLLSEFDKKEYIGLLRAQMSNYEQALLFINSISSLGKNWEYSGDVDLISKYDLIRNLPEFFIPLPGDKGEFLKPQYFYPEVNFEWKEDNGKKKNSKNRNEF